MFLLKHVETKDCEDMSRLRPAACRRKALKWTNSLNDNEKRLAAFGIPQILVTQPSCREPRLSVDVSQSKWHRYPLSLQPPCSGGKELKSLTPTKDKQNRYCEKTVHGNMAQPFNFKLLKNRKMKDEPMVLHGPWFVFF